jgi:hypothetical protein
MDLGEPTIPISSLFMKIGWKRNKRYNALTTSVNLMVVNDHGSSDRISSVDLLLIPTLLPRNLKRVIPPRTGLLRLAHSSPFSGFFVNISKEGKSQRRDLFWGIPGNRQRETNSRGWVGDLTWFSSCTIESIYQHKPRGAFLL